MNEPAGSRLALPDDPTIDRLAPDVRVAIAHHWIHRSRAELEVAHAFEQLRPRLAQSGADPAVLELVDKAIDDERRHSALCTMLAARYGEVAVAPAEVAPAALPEFGSGDEAVEVALVVLGMAAINESIASEWIRSSFKVATAPTALFANRAHLHDEIDHARLGWAHLASLDERMRARLRPYVAGALAVNIAQWKKADAHLPREGVPAHGHLGETESNAAVDAAVADVIEPGLRLLGLLPTSRAVM